MNRKIAVILPIYKKDKVEYISKAVGSIIMQTYKNCHIYIGVDGPVGDDVLIAPNSYVNCDVPSHSIVFGNPCIIKHKDNATEGYINNI